MKLGSWLAALGVAIALAPVPALGKPRPADRFDDGLRLFQRGAYTEAAKAFYAAHRAKPHPDALYNAGLAWELSGEPALAATAFAGALELELEPKARRDATKRLERLAPLLGRVEVAAPEGSVLRATPFVVKQASAVFYFQPGRRRIEVELPNGATVVRHVDTHAGVTEVVLVELARQKPEVDAPHEAHPASAAPRPKGSTAAEARDPTLGYVCLGAAGVAAGAAVVLGLQALGARDDFNASGHRDAEARDKAERLRLWTNVAWGTSAALGVTGGVFLIFTGDADPGSARLTGVGVRGRF